MFYDAFSILNSLDGKIENMKLDDEVAYIRNLKDIDSIISKFLDSFKDFNSQINEFLNPDDRLDTFYSLINQLFENLVSSSINS